MINNLCALIPQLGCCFGDILLVITETEAFPFAGPGENRSCFFIKIYTGELIYD